jgi:hypothetical protein
MDEREQDQALIKTLSAGDRAEFEALVEGFVRRELADPTPAGLRRAADSFEHVCRGKPCSDGATGLLFAAFLRERAAALVV